MSRQSKVCQCLACFIQWADDILLHGEKELNKSVAIEVIQALSTGVQVIMFHQVWNFLIYFLLFMQ